MCGNFCTFVIKQNFRIMAKSKDLKPGDPGYWDWMAKKGGALFGTEKNPGGRPKKIKTPNLLWKYACEYFNRIDERPFLKQDFIRGGEMAGSKVNLETIRPYTWAGLEAYLIEKGIISKLKDYKQNTYGNYDEFQPVVQAIDQIMFSQKFEGAASGAFNANIIARDLGLAEKTINENTNTEVPFDYSKLSDEVLEEIAKQANAGKNKSE
jgi:hypothetical protein